MSRSEWRGMEGRFFVYFMKNAWKIQTMIEEQFKKAEQACSLIGEVKVWGIGIAQSKIKEFSLKVQEIKTRHEIMSKRP